MKSTRYVTPDGHVWVCTDASKFGVSSGKDAAKAQYESEDPRMEGVANSVVANFRTQVKNPC